MKKCMECGHTFIDEQLFIDGWEEEQDDDELPVHTCPKCGNEDMDSIKDIDE